MKIKVFISSVQKELADERLALQILLTTDPFLSEHSIPILYEKYPESLKPKPQGYLDLLNSCQVYVGIIWKEYGNIIENDYSAIHLEYIKAQDVGLPILIAIKGKNNLKRNYQLDKLIKEIKKANHKYERFNNTEELQQKVRGRLMKHIKDTYHIEPTSIQEEIAQTTIKVASVFERQRLNKLGWDEMNKDLASKLVSEADEIELSKLSDLNIIKSLWQRGYLWESDGKYYGTAAGIILFGNDPTAVFTHTRIQVSVYPEIKKTHKPIDYNTIKKPLSIAIDEVVSFIMKNTRHPLRIVGLNRIQVDEYPEEAIREALVNALAHRDYEDAGKRIEVNVFKDRIEIISPGDLPGGLTLRKLLTGQARSRSRNPNIAQGLNLLDRMEERGTGIQRMIDDMLNHGLEKPVIKLVDNEVIVILYGPGDNIDRIKTPKDIPTMIIPSVEDKLNKRQKQIIKHVLETGEVTSGWCKKEFSVVYDTTYRDLSKLVDLEILEKRGKGRTTKYILKNIKE